MKNHILILFISTICFGCHKDRVSPSGNSITEIRRPGSFSAIISSGSNPIHVYYGDEFKVEIKGSDNLIPHYQTNVFGTELRLGYDKTNVSHDDIEVFVTLPMIRKVQMSGSAEITIADAFPFQEHLEFKVSGSGDIFAGNTFAVNELDIDISGSANVKLESINAKSADVNISGSGESRVRVQDRLDANISGSGKIYYLGNPTIESNISGSGKIIKYNGL